jgi:hypothetical protein
MNEPDRKITIDIGRLELEQGQREALRLLAAVPGSVDTLVDEAGNMILEMLDGLDLDGIDDESLSTLLHRFMALVAGLTIVGNGTLGAFADAVEADRLDILKAIGEDIEDN